MAHRVLAEKYAKKLNNAKQRLGNKSERIIVLETEVADLELRLEQMKVTATASTDQEAEHDLVTRQKLDEALTHIKQLEETNLNKHAEFQVTWEQADALYRSTSATVKKLQGQLKTAQNAELHFRGDAKRLHVAKRAAELRNAELTKEIAQLAQEASLNAPPAEDQSKKIEDLEGDIKAMIKERGILRSQVTRNKTTQEGLRLKLATQSPVSRAKESKQEHDAAKAEITKLQRSLDLEHTRRIEAEALLGPDGKRCKKCNPVIIDIEDD
ncbi:hypothetical protein LTR36_000085 [Oleoguttula mirabilis]|uniref:RING-type E3 ubiquitin transferase n=1 Tax=Oleoguttula mirabilis TaxID=1507867 RepID=A0AAV9JZH4_9PEZI|nr:hypothetical protein LTR36_000085 [Oleoguttula mirabilis]